MIKSKFNLENVNTVLSIHQHVNITDENLDEVRDFLVNEYGENLCSTNEEMIKEFKKAIMSKTIDKFYERYCEAPFLIITIEKGAVCKMNFPQILVYILSVRQYKKLNTVLLSKESLFSEPITNESFESYARVYCDIHNQ